jgi:hypothetical protein
MTYDGSGSLFALGMRATKLDASGAPIVGSNTCYATDALVSMGLGLEYKDGAEVEQVAGNGGTCLVYKAPDTLKGGTVSDLQLCSPDPNVMEFLIGGTVITRAAVQEVQTVTITGTPTGGTFTLTFDGQTTANIAYNAAAAAVQTALENLSNLLPGDVVVTGGPGPGTPWIATFSAALGNVAQMSATGAFTGGATPAVAVTTTTPGTNLTDIGYAAPLVGSPSSANGVSLEFWSAAIDDGAYASDLPYIHWVLPRTFLKLSDAFKLGADDPALPAFEGTTKQNSNWGDGPVGDWPFISSRVWQYARVATLPNLSPGFVTVTP